MDISLVTVIENSTENIGEGGRYTRKEKMEEESLLCFDSWRKRGGKYRDIPIYAICPSKRTLPKSTISKLKNIGVTYVEVYLEETDSVSCGYWNVPIALSWAEENLALGTIVHTDLDMVLLKEPDDELLACPQSFIAKIGTIWNNIWGRNIEPRYSTLQFETCFIISDSHSRFYSQWYTELKLIESKYEKLKDSVEFRWSEVEEHCIDYMYHDAGYKIVPISYFQVGSWYPVDSIPKGMIDKVTFLHDHIDVKNEDVLNRYTLRVIKDRCRAQT